MPAPSAQPPLASPPARLSLPVRSGSSCLFPSLYSFPWFFSFFLVDIILYRILIIWSSAYLFGNRLYDHPDCHVYQDLFRCRYNDNFHNKILLYTKTIWLNRFTLLLSFSPALCYVPIIYLIVFIYN